MSNDLEEFKSNKQWIEDDGEEVERLWRRVWQIYKDRFDNTQEKVTIRQFTAVMCGVRCKVNGVNTVIPDHSRRGKVMSHIRQISKCLEIKMKQVYNRLPTLARANRTNKYPDDFMTEYGNDEIVEYLIQNPVPRWVDTWNWSPIGYRVELPDPKPEKKTRARKPKSSKV